MSAAPMRPVDHEARERIRRSLGESLLVEAAAGTGKTTVLVDRLVEVLASGAAEAGGVVAVTFTRKAAGELELRLRQELDRARSRESDPQRRARLEAAIARLEEAKIGTLHGFCAEILRARPVEAGVDPSFTELDEDGEQQLFERVFRGFLEGQLERMPEGLRRMLARLAEAERGDPPFDRLLQAARDLAAWRDFRTPWRREPFAREAEIDGLLDQIEATLVQVRAGRPDDPLRKSFLGIEELAAALARREQLAGRRDYDELEAQLVEADRQLDGKTSWRGRGESYGPGILRQDMLAARGELAAALKDLRRRADADLAALLREELGEAVALYGEAKRSLGKLDFLDLLLFCRDLLRQRPEVRAALRRRFTHFFVDEAQDTDPLQLEILLLLAGDDPEEDDWRRARPRPGRLFLVGDPKQSTYRFRRADVLLYLEVKEQLARAGVATVELSHSFRASRNLQQAINASFARHLRHDLEAGQADYVALAGGRDEAPGQPSLVVLPVPRPYGGFPYPRVTQRAIEASFPDAVAAFLDWLLRESGFTVAAGPEGARRPLEARDVCLLFRRYQSFGRDLTADYLRALEARHLPHLLIGGRALAEREEALTLRVAATAIEWPEDALAVYGVLRGDLFALPDGCLLRYRESCGGLRPSLEPAGLDSADEDTRAVAEALRLLAELHQGRNRQPIADTLNRLLVAVRAHAGFALRPAGNQVLANVLRVIELARRYELASGLSFRGFVERLEAASGERGDGGAPGLEEGADGVRLMTVHAAKGLEFPVVLLADPTCKATGRGAPRFLDAGRGLCVLRLCGLEPVELAEAAALESRRDEAEAARLAYVAGTRARDLLILPGLGSGGFDESWLRFFDEAARPAAAASPRAFPGLPAFGRHSVLGEGPPPGSVPEIAPGLYLTAGGTEVVWWDPAALELDRPRGGGVDGEDLLRQDGARGAPEQGLRRYLEWQAEKEAALAAGREPGREVVAVTETAQPPAGAAEVRLELLAGGGGERPGGRRFGSLVHAILRDLPLEREAEAETLAGLARLHGRQLAANAAEVAAAPVLVAAFLAHPLLARARRSTRLRREVPFTWRLSGDFLVEGVIDLLFEDEEGLTVVDFKTDRPAGEILEAYLRQLSWYVAAAESLLGRPARGVLLAAG